MCHDFNSFSFWVSAWSSQRYPSLIGSEWPGVQAGSRTRLCFLSVRERKPCDRREGAGLKIVAYIKACSESHSVSNSHSHTFWQDSRFPSLSKAGPRAAATPSCCEERAGVSQGLTQAAKYALQWITKSKKKKYFFQINSWCRAGYLISVHMQSIIPFPKTTKGKWMDLFNS